MSANISGHEKVCCTVLGYLNITMARKLTLNVLGFPSYGMALSVAK